MSIHESIAQLDPVGHITCVLDEWIYKMSNAHTRCPMDREIVENDALHHLTQWGDFNYHV